MSPDPEEASPSPEPGTDPELSTMCDEKADHDSSDEKSPHQAGSDGNPTAKPNAKDPSRPRRKKARRACFACQRAHLTCGDERPCNRCIKRGLQAQCQDGVRKKAKYLHDATTEDLTPSFQTGLQHSNDNQVLINVPRASPSGQHGLSVTQSGNYFSIGATGNYAQYGPATQQGHMGPPMLDTSVVTDFGSHQPIETPHRYSSASAQQLTPNQDITDALDQSNLAGNGSAQPYEAYLNPSDPDYYQFNLNTAALNFGNHFGAQEYGMLGHIASGASDMPDVDSMNMLGRSSHSIPFDGTENYASTFGYGPVVSGNWQHVPTMAARQNSSTNIWTLHNNGLEAFAIGEHPPSLTASSPKSQNQDFSGYQNTTSEAHHNPIEQREQQDLLRLAHQHSRKAPFPGEPNTGKRKRDNSYVYSAVTKPYPYTTGFHALTAYLTKRFSRDRVLAIAKALATIRPSFIACNKNLTTEDLIFTEQAFQRAIVKYKDIIENTATPTIICRRTGEIALASREFAMLTRWQTEVLSGEQPNLNINMGKSSYENGQSNGSGATATPRVSSAAIDPDKRQPVFLAEIMDEDSVVNFYRAFAEIAIGASRSSVVGEPCTLLRYVPSKEREHQSAESFGEDGHRSRHNANGKDSHGKSEHGMEALGGPHDKIECSMCWTVKRDTFDMPLLIVMNFLPITNPVSSGRT